jgi:hypothetical protein
LAVLFDISQKQVDRVLHDLLDPLGDLLGSALTDNVSSGSLMAR